MLVYTFFFKNVHMYADVHVSINYSFDFVNLASYYYRKYLCKRSRTRKGLASGSER